MNKILSLLVLSSIAFIPTAKADFVGFEVGAYQWTPDYNGTIATIQSSQIDIQDDLGYSDDKHNIVWAIVEHPLPFIPNVKIVSSDLNSNAVSVERSAQDARSFEFDGSTYQTTEEISTTIDLSNTEITLYYEILDNWVNLDLGFTVRQYDGQVALSTPSTGSNINESEELSFTLPLLYGKARFDLPFSGFFVDGELNLISYDDDSISDMAVSLGYESDIGFGAKLGYRTFDFDIDDDDIMVDLEFSGAYLSAFYHF